MNRGAIAIALWGAGMSAAMAQDEWSPPSPRVLVHVDQGFGDRSAFRPEMSEELARRVQRALVNAKLRVVSEDGVRRVQQRLADLDAEYHGMNRDGAYARFLGAAAHAELMAEVVVLARRETKQQGRFVSEYEATLTVTRLADGAMLASKEFQARSRSLRREDGEDQLWEQWCADDGLTADAVQCVEDEHRRMIAEGRCVKVSILARERELGEGILSPMDLAGLPGVSAVEPLPSTPDVTMCSMMVRGRIDALQAAVRAFLDDERAAKVLDETGRDLTVSFASSAASLEVLLQLRDAEPPTVDEHLQSELETMAESLLRANPGWYKGQTMRFTSAHIPTAIDARTGAEDFLRAYWREYDRIAVEYPDLPDPLKYEGSVEINGVKFDSLSAARDDGDERMRQYLASPAGLLARNIAGMAEQAFQNAPEAELQTVLDESTEAAVLDVIRSEVQLFEEEDAVDPDTIAMLRREGTERMVFTRLDKAVESYRLSVTVVDLDNGMKETAAVELRADLTERLDAALLGQG